MVKLKILLLPLLGATACTPVDTGFGEALRWDLAQQIVDPDPQHAREIREGGSGERAASAVDRYHKGDVIPPAVIATSDRASGPK